MTLPIEAYGNKILREQCNDVNLADKHLNQLIENMWTTMNNVGGCGLAAPQVGKAIKLFIVDTKSSYNDFQPADRLNYFQQDDKGIYEVFINATILDYSETDWMDFEGCLSLPGLSKEVKRPWSITIEYFDKNLEKHTKTFGGYTARVIQHEYDHTNGILYIDRIESLTKKLIKGKLQKISKGLVKTNYLMKYRN